MQEEIKIIITLILILAIFSAFLHYALQENPSKANSSLVMVSSVMNICFEILDFSNTSDIKASSYRSLSSEKLNSYKNTLSDLNVILQFKNNKIIHINLTALSNLDNKKEEITKAILGLIQNNGEILKLDSVYLSGARENLRYLNTEILDYQNSIIDLDSEKDLKTILKIKKEIRKLTILKIEAEDLLMTSGKFYTISEINDFESTRKPLILYLFLYFFLAGVITILISKKSD